MGEKFPRWPLLLIFGFLGAFCYYAAGNPQVKKVEKIGAMLAVIGALILYLYFAVPPVPQDKEYHNFADKRCLCCKVPNTLDVASNIPFVLVGLVSLALQATGWLLIEDDYYIQLAWAFVFFSIVTVGFGSGYYHWKPSNATLVWDRLPMTLAFTSMTAIIMQEHAGVGVVLLPALVVLGIWSVWYWAQTDDLRPYAFVQGVPMLTLPFFLALFPAKYDGRLYYIFALAWYGFARVTEANDREIFSWTGRVISGHTLKHLAAAVALCMIPRMLATRTLVAT